MEWTDDLCLRVARGESLLSLVDYVLDSERAERPWQEVRDVLIEVRIVVQRRGLSSERERPCTAR